MDPTVNSKRKRKHSVGNSDNNISKQKKFSRNSNDSSKFPKKKKSFGNKNITCQAGSTTDFQNSNKSGKFDKSVNTNMKNKFKKKKLKITEHAVPDPQSVIQPKDIKKLKKKKNFKTGINIKNLPSGSKDASVSLVGKKVSKVGKITSKSEENEVCESDVELSDFCISDDDDEASDEEVLREEIQSSKIFKQIEKLMKKAPHLNPANAPSQNSRDDDEEDNSLDSLVESDDEESAIESDDQDASSSESELEASSAKNAIRNKQSIPAKGEEKKAPVEIKKSSLFNVPESTGFNRTSKVNALSRNISDTSRKGEMSSNLKNKVLEKLAGAKFRFLNEKLYTETGKEAFKYFQENAEEFDDYHSGYRLQVSKWPINPVNEIIADIQKLKKSFVIADLGCGEAKIAQTFPDRTIHSFDLVPLNEFVKSCDISKIPLPNESVDVAVFCLSLMGTNLKDYLCEAFRILKVGGILKIAEVESRIDDLGHFINYLKSIGFTLGRKNTKHKMFVFLDLKKEKQNCKLGKVPSLTLRPCLYKKR